jgi:HSP20 family molecular chaperone IbpA
MFYKVHQRDQSRGEGALEHDPWAQEGEHPFVIVSRRAWRPPTDVYETASEVVIKMELAGVREGDLDISITGEVLSVRGLRRDAAAGHKIGYHHMGITYGEFAFDISLPGPVERDSINAEYDAGFLIIKMPKARPRQTGPVRVQINSQPDD